MTNNKDFDEEELKKIIERNCAYIQKNLREAIDNILTTGTDLDSEDKLWILNLLTDYDFLHKIGKNIYESPDIIYSYLECDEEYPRYSIYYFTKYLDIVDDEDREEAINKIWDYVKEHKIIGCINDW